MQAEAIEAGALRRSDELKTSLLRSVSHDLRTPLTSIIAAGAALDSPSVTAEERHELSEAVVEQGQRLSRLVENLLDVSRLQTGNAEPHREPVDLAGPAGGGAATRSAPDGEAVRLALDAELPPLSADPTQLERAFANLLENAVVHGGGEPVLVRSRLVGPRRRGPRRRPRAGDPRAASASGSSSPSTGVGRQGGGGGSGLGLAIAKGFVEANGGEIAVESLPGQGSSFVVSFAAPDGAGRDGGRRGMSDRPRILVCDDEPQILRALKVILRDAGFEAVPASDAARRRSTAPPSTARGGDPRPDAARHRRGRGDAAAARVEPDADRRPLRRRRGGPQGRGAGGRRRRLRDQAVRPARAGRPPARRRCAAPGPRPRSRRSSPTGSRSTSPPARVRRDGEAVHLTPTEFGLLRELARNRGRLMTHRTLLVEVWGVEYEDDFQVLRAHIANLRRKIEPPGRPQVHPHRPRRRLPLRRLAW